MTRPGIEPCPRCEGTGRMVDMRYSNFPRARCYPCKGTGQVDAGVWPYYPPGAQEGRLEELLGEAQKGGA